MKYLVILAGLGLAACEQQADMSSSTATTPAVQRISTVEQIQPLLDRRWNFGDGMYTVLRPDGSFAGDFGRSVAGTWEMRDGYWCRTITQGAGTAPPTNCQLLQGDGSNFTATRDKGTGKAVPFTLGAAA